MNAKTTLTAIAFIDTTGKPSLSVFRNGQVPCRLSWAAVADLAIILNEEMEVVDAAIIKAVNEDGTFVLGSVKDAYELVIDLDLSEVFTTTPWVRRRPTRYVTFTVNAKGIVTTFSETTAETVAAKATTVAA